MIKEFRRFISQMRKPPTDMYVRIDQVDTILAPLWAINTAAESCGNRISACEDQLEKIDASMQDLKTQLQRFSNRSSGKISRQLAEAVGYQGDDANFLYRAFAGTDVATLSLPSTVPLTSSLCHQHHFLLDQFRFWIRSMKLRPKFHRKYWEWFYITQALFERGVLSPGKRGIGFGVGQEPLPSLFASFGAEIVATDQPMAEAEKTGWAASGQYARDLSPLNEKGICTEAMFSNLVDRR